MHTNRLLNSAKPGHTEPSDQSAAKKTLMIVIKAKGAYVEFHVDKFCVQIPVIVAVTFTVCSSSKLGKNAMHACIL